MEVDWSNLKASNRKIIYLLTDPRPDKIYCYVGQTNSAERFRSHFRRSQWTSTPKAIWIHQLADIGLTPDVHLLDTCYESDADNRERYWIRSFEYSPLHILVNGYVERASARGAIIEDILPPHLGRKDGVLADLSFIIDLTKSYRIWLMKKASIPATIANELDVNLPSWKYWDQILRERTLKVICASSGNLQHPFITQAPEDSKITCFARSENFLSTRRRLGLLVL